MKWSNNFCVAKNNIRIFIFRITALQGIKYGSKRYLKRWLEKSTFSKSNFPAIFYSEVEKEFKFLNLTLMRFVKLCNLILCYAFKSLIYVKYSNSVFCHFLPLLPVSYGFPPPPNFLNYVRFNPTLIWTFKKNRKICLWSALYKPDIFRFS